MKCDHHFEHFQSMSDLPLTVCPLCGSTIRRLVSGGSGLIFKGKGFYLTDYKKNKTNTSLNKNKSTNKTPKTKTSKKDN